MLFSFHKFKVKNFKRSMIDNLAGYMRVRQRHVPGCKSIYVPSRAHSGGISLSITVPRGDVPQQVLADTITGGVLIFAF